MPVSRAYVRRGPRLPWGSIALLLILLLVVAGCATMAPAAPAATTAPDRAASVARNKATPTATPRRSAATRTTADAQGQASPSSIGGLAIPTPLLGDNFRTVAVAQLPPEAVTTLTLIGHDGPFPYSQDGVVFQNREGLLPRQANGYYHEYTVKTPGASDRGARRIIRGSRGELFYTDDHYASFRRIVP